ncbi:MAG TPA: hypothetical protein VF911_01880, partial [Thermoanaerobaculia bacterium]
MKKAALIAGFIAIMLFGCATNPTSSGAGMHPAAAQSRTVVAREWKGRVAPARADEYYAYLLAGVKKMSAIAGYRAVEIMRRDEPS